MLLQLKIDSNAHEVANAVVELFGKKAIRNELDTKMSRLVSIMEKTAQRLYGNSVKVVGRQARNSMQYEVVARGSEVVFLEFGAGDTTDSAHPFADRLTDIEVKPGSWSKEHAMQYSTKGYWYYNGKKLTYIYPTRALLRASEDGRRYMQSMKWGK